MKTMAPSAVSHDTCAVHAFTHLLIVALSWREIMLLTVVID